MDPIDLDQELTRAALPQAVLAVLNHGESHGYAIAEVLRLYGFSRLKGGTLYPLLKRLEDQGFVEHTWQHDHAGPGRKQFTLTEQGRRELERTATAWRRMSQALTEIRTTRQERP
ncbi:PadR family transcriptional regulator [Arthrobacter sp. PAMC25284]|uniref:PadR family transcriptional regulator n=1 Tax=Arthrobacter sp. PAMC25284 TaxID=2861279 RepID=UPI001C6279E9|nr:PadR family transcriptional regulator [Arthrobacter sp. PAMC25284]QYF90441.1 PadR family transcriptional regulator [Arthrobacter sp. PAMC25284]